MVEAGSDVAFRWTIDDKQSLTFYNTVFNVIYQSAAIFKLSVGRGQWREAWGPGTSGCSLLPSVLLCFAPEDPAAAVGECGEAAELGLEAFHPLVCTCCLWAIPTDACLLS